MTEWEASGEMVRGERVVKFVDVTRQTEMVQKVWDRIRWGGHGPMGWDEADRTDMMWDGRNRKK